MVTSHDIEYMNSVYSMLYTGVTEDRLAGVPSVDNNEVLEKIKGLFSQNVPNYDNLPEIKISDAKIVDGYIHLTPDDLKNCNVVSGTDCYGRLFVALHVLSRATATSRIVTIFQLSLQEASLCASSHGEGLLGHNELFDTSSPSWDKINSTLEALRNGRHPSFLLAAKPTGCESFTLTHKISLIGTSSPTRRSPFRAPLL